MKYSFKLKVLGNVFNSLVKDEVKNNKLLKDIVNEYKNIIIRAKDIGDKNNLITSYALAAYFIAMNRKNNISPEENIKIISGGMKNSKILKLFLGNSNNYFSDKKMKFRKEWSKKTYKKKYENDWVVDFIDKKDDFEFGLDYLECGVCKLCKDENCFEYAKYLCQLDFLLVKIIGINLERTKTIADGFEKCDFRFKK